MPVLDRDDIGIEPTVPLQVFGQVTLPVPVRPVRPSPVPSAPLAHGIVKAHPRMPTPTPFPRHRSPTPTPRVMDDMVSPLIAPPPSPTRGIAIGFTIGTSVGLAILGACWHFFL